jgi:mercuric ion binding protein
MKKILSIGIFTILGLSANAQVMQAKAAWATYTVPQLKCWECKERLEKYISRETGPNGEASVLKVVTNMYNGTMRVQYVPDRITADYIRSAISNAGFDVDSLKASPDAYKVLPPVCKRKEEGGGPQKGKPCNIPPDGQ